MNLIGQTKEILLKFHLLPLPYCHCVSVIMSGDLIVELGGIFASKTKKALFNNQKIIRFTKALSKIHSSLHYAKVSGISYLKSSMSLDVSECVVIPVLPSLPLRHSSENFNE